MEVSAQTETSGSCYCAPLLTRLTRARRRAALQASAARPGGLAGADEGHASRALLQNGVVPGYTPFSGKGTAWYDNPAFMNTTLPCCDVTNT